MARAFTGAGSSTDLVMVPVAATPYYGFATFSLCAWCFQTGLGGSSLGSISELDNMWHWGVRDASNLQLSGDGWTTTAGVWSYAKPSSSVWHHHLLTYDAGGGTGAKPVLYVDGRSVTVTTVTTPAGSWAPPAIAGRTLNLGCNSGNVEQWQGSLAMFAAWNRVLTAAEALAVFTQGPLAVLRGLRGLWPLDGGARVERNVCPGYEQWFAWVLGANTGACAPAPARSVPPNLGLQRFRRAQRYLSGDPMAVRPVDPLLVR